MSVLGKKWLIKNHDNQKTVFERLLENRGIKDVGGITEFHDPHLFNDMEKVLQRLDKAIQDQERIIVFGDYDVDGISGTALLVHILKKVKANVSYRLPNRLADGYGLSSKFIDEFIEKNINIIITVDCGISCRNEVEKANSAGIDVIITDHHTVPEFLPAAYAILHPKLKDTTYPFRELTGAGVALKLAHALINKYLPENERQDYLYSLLDLATLGTIADLGSLTDENRLIVIKGLESLTNTKWAGLKKIKELASIKEGIKMNTTNIGFQMAPRINAAGRIGDPYTALSLLLQEEEGEQVTKLGDKLESLNKERQQMTEQALHEAEAIFLNQENMPSILIAYSATWHVGILGLVAGKLAEKYGRPAIAMQDFGDTLVASARSPEYFNIVDALTNTKEHLINFGGHAQAAGFSLNKDKLADFTKDVSEYARTNLEKVELKTILEIDCQLSGEEIDENLLSTIEKLQPFGVDNRKPTFVMKGIEPFFVNQVGQDGNHLKFTVKYGEKKFPVIAFRMGQFIGQLRQHRKIDLVFQLEHHSWNEREFIQLQALDFKPNE
ncbi:MAG: single-stranded-DNA-specific exonuclease RecJ [Candidatus Peregrinibacteria bacterium]|nr:single-stranded-DNA-specific exonuclease RecJ [Candidatus Peregrinibacteria bacterium]